MDRDQLLRTHVGKLLEWEDAHLSFDRAIEGFPPDLRGVAPAGLPYSAWQLLEHLRLTQLDILDFCRKSDYVDPASIDEYWPKTAYPPTTAAWDESLRSFRQDRDALKTLASDRSVDLFAKIPHGTGQTYLRELLLAADHNAYHVGQIVILRRSLGVWKG